MSVFVDWCRGQNVSAQLKSVHFGGAKGAKIPHLRKAHGQEQSRTKPTRGIRTFPDFVVLESTLLLITAVTVTLEAHHVTCRNAKSA